MIEEFKDGMTLRFCIFSPSPLIALSLTLHERLGSGAYGAVYHARWCGQPCAAKKYFLSQTEYHQQSIQNEISILRRLRHRNVVQYYETLHQQGSLYLLMDIAENGSLAHAIMRTQLDWPTRTRFAHEMARGLEYIHGEGIVHRDLKSANVLLSSTMEVKLADFGLADTKSTSASRSVDAAVIVGTMRWLAPELLVARPKYTNMTDIYAFGVVMWEMAAGCTKPFKDQVNTEMVAALVRSGEREEIPEETPPEYHNWVERCWHQEPAKRPEAIEVILVDAQPVVHTSDSDQSFLSISASTDGTSFSNRTRSGTTNDATRPNIENGKLGDGLEDAALRLSSTTSLSPSPSHVQQSPEPQHHHDNQPSTGRRSKATDEDALGWLRKSAEQGSSEARYRLGLRYLSGQGVERSNAEAASWFLMAAKQGNVGAQSNMGYMYQNGLGVERDDAEAVAWFREAASKGVVQAYYNLGLMFAEGRGVEQNDTEAVKWYLLAAQQGFGDAQCNLAFMFQHGRGLPQSDTEAVSWLRKAVRQGNAEATNSLGFMYIHGRGGVEQSDDEALSLFRKSASQGNPKAQHNLGWMYYEGRSVERNDAEAVAWYKKAADQGFADAEYNLGLMYDGGRGVDQSDDEATKWILRAAEQGHSLAQCTLGSIYLKGDCVENYVQAADWYRMAALQGNEDAQFHLGEMLASGQGVKLDIVEAVLWYRMAGEQGLADAQVSLGRIFELGQGVEQSNDEAAQWYLKAAEQGNLDAQRTLKALLEKVERTDLQIE
ncbi:hypothetical protein DFQ27_003272 [Actinomortierella ambigua]|uniref:Protein kinase domain-containing protein n=1 Tax=Actinomortierella ambigua TaxID=1343610 RepID=A0A9P6Q8M9_9FUNG|nr:hypothetical protein DFQ27_003272 [Actinomortierella ambigua]